MDTNVLASLLLGKTSRVPFRQLVGSQSRSEGLGTEVNLMPLPGIEPKFLCPSALSLVTTAATVNVLPKLVSSLVVKGGSEGAMILHCTNTSDCLVSATEQIVQKFYAIRLTFAIVVQAI
jgi:hypothetical protein